ncbi:MAG: BON domain-containing protein [Rhodopirellula sp.]|nr:BON domain-containing protein [Rhodopirellula sp.]
MLRRNQVPDKTLLQKLNQRMMRTGTGSQCRVSLAVHNGDVTVSGTIQFEHQRRMVLRAAGGIEGVRRVTDTLRIVPPKKHQPGKG